MRPSDERRRTTSWLLALALLMHALSPAACAARTSGDGTVVDSVLGRIVMCLHANSGSEAPAPLPRSGDEICTMCLAACAASLSAAPPPTGLPQVFPVAAAALVPAEMPVPPGWHLTGLGSRGPPSARA